MRIAALTVLLGCVLLSSCQPADTGEPAAPTAAPPANTDEPSTATSARQLFNGQNLNGWDIVNGGQFSVEDGRRDAASGLRRGRRYGAAPILSTWPRDSRCCRGESVSAS